MMLQNPNISKVTAKAICPLIKQNTDIATVEAHPKSSDTQIIWEAAERIILSVKVAIRIPVITADDKRINILPLIDWKAGENEEDEEEEDEEEE